MSSNRKFMYKNRTPSNQGRNRNQRNFVNLMQLVRRRHRELIYLTQIAETSVDSSGSSRGILNIEELLQPPIRRTRQNNRRTDRTITIDTPRAVNVNKAIQVNIESIEQVQNTNKPHTNVQAAHHPNISNHDDKEKNDHDFRTITGQANSHNDNHNIFLNPNAADGMPSVNSVNDSHLVLPKSEDIEPTLTNENTALNSRTNEVDLVLENHSPDRNDAVSGDALHHGSLLQIEVILESQRHLPYRDVNTRLNEVADEDSNYI